MDEGNRVERQNKKGQKEMKLLIGKKAQINRKKSEHMRKTIRQKKKKKKEEEEKKKRR